MRRERNKRHAVVAATPDDSHQWNLIGVELKLKERGFSVTNLGSCTPPDLVAQTVRDLRPELLVISTVNGHGALSVKSVLHALEEYQLKRATKIVVGGLLTTDPAGASCAADCLVEVGCDGVFFGETAWKRFDSFVDRAFVSTRK